MRRYSNLLIVAILVGSVIGSFWNRWVPLVMVVGVTAWIWGDRGRDVLQIKPVWARYYIACIWSVLAALSLAILLWKGPSAFGFAGATFSVFWFWLHLSSALECGWHRDEAIFAGKRLATTFTLIGALAAFWLLVWPA